MKVPSILLKIQLLTLTLKVAISNFIWNISYQTLNFSVHFLAFSSGPRDCLLRHFQGYFQHLGHIFEAQIGAPKQLRSFFIRQKTVYSDDSSPEFNTAYFVKKLWKDFAIFVQFATLTSPGWVAVSCRINRLFCLL